MDADSPSNFHLKQADAEMLVYVFGEAQLGQLTPAVRASLGMASQKYASLFLSLATAVQYIKK